MEAQDQVYYKEAVSDDVVIKKNRNAVRGSKRTVIKHKSVAATRTRVKTKAISKKMVLVSFGLVTLILIISTLYGYIVMSNAGLEIGKLENEINSLEAERDYYRMEIEKYSSTERIEKIAKDKLAMYYPDESNYYYIENELDNNKKENKEVAKSEDGLINEKKQQ